MRATVRREKSGLWVVRAAEPVYVIETPEPAGDESMLDALYEHVRTVSAVTEAIEVEAGDLVAT